MIQCGNCIFRSILMTTVIIKLAGWWHLSLLPTSQNDTSKKKKKMRCTLKFLFVFCGLSNHFYCPTNFLLFNCQASTWEMESFATKPKLMSVRFFTFLRVWFLFFIRVWFLFSLIFRKKIVTFPTFKLPKHSCSDLMGERIKLDRKVPSSNPAWILRYCVKIFEVFIWIFYMGIPHVVSGGYVGAIQRPFWILQIIVNSQYH